MSVLYVSALFLSYKPPKFGILSHTAVFLWGLYCANFSWYWSTYIFYSNMRCLSKSPTAHSVANEKTIRRTTALFIHVNHHFNSFRGVELRIWIICIWSVLSFTFVSLLFYSLPENHPHDWKEEQNSFLNRTFDTVDDIFANTIRKLNLSFLIFKFRMHRYMKNNHRIIDWRPS